MGKNKEVDDWFRDYENPQKKAMLRAREVILAADSRIGECIKWNAPTFSYKGNLASFNPRSKKHVSLMFHHGADIPGDHPRLEGSGSSGRNMKLAGMDGVEEAREDLEAVVRAWCDFKDGRAD